MLLACPTYNMEAKSAVSHTPCYGAQARDVTLPNQRNFSTKRNRTPINKLNFCIIHIYP